MGFGFVAVILIGSFILAAVMSDDPSIDHEHDGPHTN
jgi:hypothetical protein